MTFHKLIVFALFVLLTGLTAGRGALADEPATVQPLSIAVVDIQQLMSDSKAAKSIQSQGKKIRDRYQGEIEDIEKDLKKTEESIVKSLEGADRVKILEEREKFQKDVLESQKEVRRLNAKLDKALGDALNTLRDEIVSIVSGMAKDEGYDLVISRADVVIVSKSIDITSDVMKELDKRLPSVKVKD